MEQSIIHVTRVYAIFGEVHKIDKILGGVGVGVYGSLAIFMIVSFLWSTFKKKSELSNLANNVRRVFRVFISLFVITRIIWVSMHAFYGQGDTATFILNRAGVMTFMTAFTLVVFYWAERFHKTYYESTTFLPKVGWAFILLNVVMYTFQIIMIFLFVFKDDQREGNPIYEVNIGLDLVVSALISIGFFSYGWLLFCMMKANDVENAERKIDLLKILVISLIFTACFLLRVIVFLYRPITGKKFNEIAFYCTAYYIPELIPTILQVYLTETAKEKQEKDEHYIDDLYAEADSSKDSLDQEQKPIDENQNLISTPRGDSDRVDRVSMFNSNNYGTI